MRLPSRLVRISIVVSGALIVLILAGVAESYYERSQAEKLLGVLSRIEVGDTTKAQAKDALKPFARYSTLRYFPNNSADDFDQYGFLNRALAFLHLSTRTRVWITVNYKDGVVIEKHVQAASEPRCSGSVGESVHNEIPSSVKYTETDEGRTVSRGGDPGHPYFVIQVRDDLSTPLDRRKLDWQIDLSCLTWRKGCTDPRKTLRGAFTPITVGQRSN